MTTALHATPFEQGRFAELPQDPRLPHAFRQTTPIEISFDAPGFGPTTAHVRKHGSGPPLLLVHGLMTSSYSWRYVFEPLGEHFTCYAPDLPGAGRTPPSHDVSYDPSSLTGWLAELQRALGIRGCAAIGNSMGGYLCMKLALDDPGSMQRLVNLHSPGVPEPRLTALACALAIPGAHGFLRWLINRNPRRWAHGNVHYYDETLKSLEEAAEYGDVLAGANAQTLVKYLGETMHVRHIRAFRDLAKRSDFPIPLLLLYARKDPMVPPRFGPILAEWTGGDLCWLEEGSHFAHVDRPALFLKPTLAFLAAPHL